MCRQRAGVNTAQVSILRMGLTADVVVGEEEFLSIADAFESGEAFELIKRQVQICKSRKVEIRLCDSVARGFEGVQTLESIVYRQHRVDVCQGVVRDVERQQVAEVQPRVQQAPISPRKRL